MRVKYVGEMKDLLQEFMDLEWVVLERHVWFCVVGFSTRKKKVQSKRKLK